MTIRTLALLAAGVLLAGCSDTALSIVCPDQPDPAIVISVVDPGGTQSLADRARGWYRVGTQSDSLRYHATAGGGALLATGPAGTYRVEVRVDGHAPWHADAVEVAGSACGVQTVRLEAAPTPL